MSGRGGWWTTGWEVPNEVRAAFEMPDILPWRDSSQPRTADSENGEGWGGPCKNKIMGPKKDVTFVTVQHSVTAYV